MALTSEVYEAIVRIVDERVAEIKVTREDFDKLSKNVSDLSMAVRELAEGQKRTDEAVRELAEGQKRTDEAVRELVEAHKRTDQSIGRLSDTIGHDIESMARVNVPDWLQLHAKVKVRELRRRIFKVDDEDIEVDLYGEGRRGRAITAIVGEVKSKIHGRDVEYFARRVERLESQLHGRVVKIMFGFWIHPSAEEQARRLRIHVIAPPGTYSRGQAKA